MPVLHRVLLSAIWALSLTASAQDADIDLPDISPSAAATVAAQPVPEAGSHLVFDGRVGSVDCQRWTVGAVNADGELLSTCGQFTSHLSVEGDFNLHKITAANDEPLVVFEPWYPVVMFPLEVGKRWERPYTGYLAAEGLRWEGRIRCEVADFGAIDLAAGPLDAFRIECYDKQKVGLMETGATLTLWYAPAVPAIVKTIHYEDARWNSTLVDYGPR